MKEKNNSTDPTCASCRVAVPKRACYTPAGEGVPGPNCPTVEQTEALAAANAVYQDPQVRAFAQETSRQEAACYANRHESPYIPQPSKPRIQEIWEFARRMNYQKLGLVFCMGLAKEAALVEDLFQSKGFEVVSAVCKAGATPKEYLGLSEEDKIRHGQFEALCNPIFQAELMNRAGTELNIVLGLCVGHDSLFMSHAKAPNTVLAVKDRVTGHNPLAAVYNLGDYFSRLKSDRF